MVVKIYYFLLIILLISTYVQSTIHLDIHEKSYSAADKYKYINDCLSICMENNQQGIKKNTFIIIRDHCIQTQCRIY